MAAQRPRFASRTAWNLAPNRLARLAEEKRCAGEAFLDLTESNPTRCGFHYEEEAILEALADRRGLKYDPDPRGLLKARRAVVGYYQARQVSLAPDQVLLTSGSSEAYGYLFRLLAEPGANVLAPRPSYPLFEFLSSLNDIELRSYALDEHHRWQIDFG
ncbi:MAG: aminotransferase class I/II-fold pyridoxal phosphate-dependent enzyme, partial [Acidobacteria bacterium]|nr:aminotransferase class I/II-fold pyridoxal phosphate-dependent enzyme [Acidobacteriota bacterium]